MQNRFSGLVTRLGAGEDLDLAQERAKEAVALREAMLGYMDNEMKHAKDQYKFLTDDYSRVVRPKLGELTEFFKNISQRNYTGGDQGQSLMLEDMIRLFSKLGLGYSVCSDCLKKFDMRMDNYIRGGKADMEKYLMDLEANFSKTKMKIQGGDGSLHDLHEIERCYQSLLRDSKDCVASYAPAHVLRHLISPVDCSELSQTDCESRELFCEYEGTSCKPKGDDEIRRKLSELAGSSVSAFEQIMNDNTVSSSGSKDLISSSSADLSSVANLFGGNKSTGIFNKRGY